MTSTAPAARMTPPATVPGLPNRVTGATASKAPAIATSAKPISAILTPVCLVKANMVILPLSRLDRLSPSSTCPVGLAPARSACRNDRVLKEQRKLVEFGHGVCSPRSYACTIRPASVLIGLVLLLGACGAASGAAPSSGIAGRVVAGPTCPVETVPPQPQCAPRPLMARLRIHPLGSRLPSTMLSSTEDGRFVVHLAPAIYVVQALRQNGSLYPRPPAPVQVRVDSGRLTRITITYDTGIR